jgi:DNA repair protein SbcC/Rad50
VRPSRIELEGFTAFRDRTVVDLAGVDLFALCGPTGAGKSSVIDAITFALYGSVPRLEVGSVAPVIAQNALEARVRLDFTVGEAAYVAVRVVRATKAGASTKEARLESAAGDAIAADAKGMTVAVTDLLGLDFRQFTTCVSLPQGDFARFLHAEPRHRQDLLVRLLDLGLFERVAHGARQRERVAADRAAVAEAHAEKLAFASPAALAGAERRATRLAAVRDEVDAVVPELERLGAEATTADAAAEAAIAAVAVLTGVVAPDGVEALAAELTGATAARTAAVDAEAEATEGVDKAEAALAALPAREELERRQREHAEVDRLEALAAKGGAAVEAARMASAARAATSVTARTALDAADEAVHTARTNHLAHALAAEVVVGEPCPVCRQTVTEAPAPPPADVAAAERARAKAKQRHDAAARDAEDAGKEQARVEAKLAGVEEQLDALRGRLAGAPSVEAVAVALADVVAAEATLKEARAAATEVRLARLAAQARADAATEADAAARRAFDSARDSVAALGPPVPARVDLAADWAGLVAWATERRPSLQAEADGQRVAAEAARGALTARRDALAARCRDAGVEPGDRPRDAVVDAVARAEAEVRRIAEALTEAAAQRTAAEVARADAAVAGALANHLRADGFERWILEEALRELVSGATALLQELSGGAYSLTLDAKSRVFAVVDHVNADTVRPARTLSGGETFLASLALALALADQVAASAGAAARLETILLDEGFGTLDAETLDVVATALEELGARGRMVGVVTHVRELADRLPVRFELRKVGGASTVERIDQ